MLPSKKFITVSELMERWRCTRPTVLRYLRDYNAEVNRFGRKFLVPEDEVIRIENQVTTNHIE